MEKVFICPWCGATLEKGKFHGSTYAFVKDGMEMKWAKRLASVSENETGVYIRNWVGLPVAYACRQCRKIIHPY